MRTPYFLIFVVMTACSTLPRAIEPPTHSQIDHKSKKIYVGNHGWHTGIILPAVEIFEDLPLLGQRFQLSDYLEIGWGDAGFYQAEEITTQLTIQAIFWPSDTVVHVVGIDIEPSNYFAESEIKELFISELAYGNLLKFLKSSFALDESGNIVSIKSGIYGNSQFYEGIGSYYALNTCNKWTAKALYSAGFDIQPVFKFTASSVMRAVSEQR